MPIHRIRLRHRDQRQMKGLASRPLLVVCTRLPPALSWLGRSVPMAWRCCTACCGAQRSLSMRNLHSSFGARIPTSQTGSPADSQIIRGRQDRPIASRPMDRRSWAAMLLLIVIGFAGTLVWALHDLPPGTSLAGSVEPSVIFETSDGKPLARKGPFKAADMSSAEFPDTLVDAVISIEDRRFYSHWGVDSRGILRALARNISAGEVVEGGSTINQQLVKILHLERDRTLKRKIREAAIAVWLDVRLGKDEILTRYLNNIYLGAGATGVPAAARIYFDKNPADLTLAESAMLAGLIKAPSQLNPLKDLDAARSRAAVVLDAMVAAGRLEADAATAAKEHPATLAPSRIDAHTGTWFADWVAKEAAEITGSFRGTMRVRTTLVPELQAAAEAAISTALADASEAHGASQAALVAIGRTALCSPWWAARAIRTASSTGPSTPCASPARPSSSSSILRPCATASRRATGSRTPRLRSRVGSRRISANATMAG